MAQQDYKTGDKMHDGTIYVCTLPYTGYALYVTPADVPVTMTFGQAARYVAGLNVNGHRDWSLPTKAELGILFANKHEGALKGTFNETGSDPDGVYLSSTKVPYSSSGNACLWMRYFGDGDTLWGGRDVIASVRPVRVGPLPS